MEYYTYAYLREDGTPYYIGKGKNRRAFDRKKHTVFVPSKDRIIFLKQNLTEEQSIRHEIYMIAVFGRKDLGTGILHNKTDGGDGCSGYFHSEKHKKRMSKLQTKRWSKDGEKDKIRGKNNPFFNKSHSEDSKIKIGLKSKIRTQGIDNPRTKTWKLIFENEKVLTIKCLKLWCRENGYLYNSVLNVYRNLSKNHKGIVSVIQL
jgi:hypothetical protein